MDFWAQRCVEEIAEAEATGKQADKHTTDLGMGDTIMDFLFASQDASTASLVWMLNLMADYPDVLEKVRKTNFGSLCLPPYNLLGIRSLGFIYADQPPSPAGCASAFWNFSRRGKVRMACQDGHHPCCLPIISFMTGYGAEKRQAIPLSPSPPLVK